MTPQQIQERLFSLQDNTYRDFNAKLLPTVDKNTVIGVRTPYLRKLAAEMYRSGDYREFIDTLPHHYYEENNLHGYIIEQFKDYNECVAELERFLPYIDNWGICDSICPKIFKKHTTELLPKIYNWIASDKAFTVRYAIGMLMRFYLDDEFDTHYPQLVSKTVSDEYYVNMMIAWYFATALAKQYNAAIPYLENAVLPKWVHNKTIQKAVESYRISDNQKAYLKKLKI